MKARLFFIVLALLFASLPRVALAQCSVLANGVPFNCLGANGITSNAQISATSLPANAHLLYVILRNTTANAVTINLGITPGGTEIASAQPVPGASANTGTLAITTTAFSKDWFSATAAQPLYISSSNWNSASLNAQVNYQQGP